MLMVVNGIPGTGKTTLSRKLARDLELPCIGKDDIKELLFERLGTADLTWSQDLGIAAVEALFTLAERFAVNNRNVILENAYYRDFAQPRFAALQQDRSVAFLEIYCQTEPEVWRQRFRARAASGERHPGHHYSDPDDLTDKLVARYAPLRLGETITVDTTDFGDAEYRVLLHKVADWMNANRNNEEKV